MSILADGQLAASAAALFTGDQATSAVNLFLSNTSGVATETVVVTLTPNNGATARRVARRVLAPNEQSVIRGLPMGNGDVLKGQATDATTVDYVVSAGGGPLEFTDLDATGARKTVASAISGAQTISGDLTVQGRRLESVETGVTAAGSTVSDATGLAAGKGRHVVTGADGTKGVKIDNTDDLAGMVVDVTNVTAGVLKVYPPTGGTINGGSANAAFSSASGKNVKLTCDAPGTWRAANYA